MERLLQNEKVTLYDAIRSVRHSNQPTQSNHLLQSYDETISKYHGWAVRKAAGLAFYTLPYRDQFFAQIGVKNDKTPVKNLVTYMSGIYKNVHNQYVKFNLQSLA